VWLLNGVSKMLEVVFCITFICAVTPGVRGNLHVPYNHVGKMSLIQIQDDRSICWEKL
jgi:hypothetical protein